MTDAAYSRGDLPPALQQALEAALDTKAVSPTILRVTEIAGYTDWVLLLSGRSDRHVRGITESIVDALRQQGVRPIGTDGLEDHLWDLLDFDDFIVHVFYHPVRVYYDLESMWSDAPRVDLKVSAEVMDVSGLALLPAPDVMPGYRGQEFGAFEDELDPDLGDDDDDDDAGDDDFTDEDDLGDDELDGDQDEWDDDDDFIDGDGDPADTADAGDAAASPDDEAAPPSGDAPVGAPKIAGGPRKAR